MTLSFHVLGIVSTFKLNLIEKTKFTKVFFEESLPKLRCDWACVERDALKVKEINGKRSKLIDITLEDHE